MTMHPSTVPGAMNCLKEDVPQNDTATVIQYQRHTGSTPGYTVPAGGGVITSWTYTAPGPVGWPETAALRVFRPAGGTQFQVIGQSAEETIVGDGVGAVPNSFSTRIPVQAGDVLGISLAHLGNVAYCQEPATPFTTGDRTREINGTGDPGAAVTGTTLNFSGNEQMARLDLAAIVEPDVDGDGLGDVTQDPDHGAGTSTPPAGSGGSALAPAPVTPPKKCRKGRKLKKGKCVKKKKKK
jgi:hypothetical protein